MRWPALALLGLIGCQPVTRIGDKIIGLTNPVLVGGLVVGATEPEDDRLALALQAAGLTDLTEVRMVAADALELRDIDGAVVEDAALTLETPELYDMEVGEDGWFSLGPPRAPRYVPGRTWTLTADLPDRVLPGTVRVPLPEAAVLDFDPAHPPGEDLVIDLSGQGFDFAYAAIYDWRGRAVWTNEPTDNDAIVDLVLPGGDPVDEVVIPAEAFPDESLYLLGVAGTRRAPAEGVEGLNEALTAVLAGEIVLQPIVSGSPVGLVGMVIASEPVPPAVAPLLAELDVPLGGRAEVFVTDLLSERTGVATATAAIDGTPLPPADPEGRYGADGLDLTPGDAARIEVDVLFADPAGIDVVVPPAVQLDPPDGVAGSPLSIDLPGGPWASVLCTVVGSDGLTWSNVPETGEAWGYVLRHEGAMDSLVVPGAAFPAAGTYAIVLAALESRPDALFGANPDFSQALAGTTTFALVDVD